jgi:hypothetical protein
MTLSLIAGSLAAAHVDIVFYVFGILLGVPAAVVGLWVVLKIAGRGDEPVDSNLILRTAGVSLGILISIPLVRYKEYFAHL